MKTRIYGRFSSKPQERGDSKRRQIEGARNYAVRHGLNVIGEPYFDEGVSGKAGANLEREFGRILSDSESGDCILCEFLDRIGRQSPFLLGKLLYDTVQKGITVIAWAEGKTINKENINQLDTMFSVFTGTAIGFNENERKIKRSKDINTESYKNAVNGMPSKNVSKFLPECYFWNEAQKQIDINEDKAKTIRFIFNEYTNGKGTTTICQNLNKSGVATPYKKRITGKWNETTIRNILRNETYAGVATIKGNRITCFKGVVSKEQFEKAQLLLERNSNRHGKTGENSRINNLFKNVAVCLCGGKLIVKAIMPFGKKRKKASYSFYCRNARSGICDIRSMWNVTPIEMFFFSEFLNGDGSQLLSKGDNDLKFKRDSLIQRIEQKETAISNLYDMAEQGDETARNRIAERRAEKVQLEKELRQIKGSIAESDYIPTLSDRLDDLIGKDGFKAARDSYFPTIRAKLSDNETRRELSVMLPSMIKQLVVNLKDNEFYAVKKDGTKTKTINVNDYIQDLTAQGIPLA